MSKTLPERVDEFVQWLFAESPDIPVRGPKVINDAIHGNQHFAKHEIAVINCPLLQRLKRIKQTGLVYQVFPTAQHTRFEHTLGVVTVAERIFHALRARANLENETQVLDLLDVDIRKGDLAHVRMAALLHDVGHGLCSHAAEQIYGIYSDMGEFAEYQPNAPGEVLSMLMVTSKTFGDWFNANVNGNGGANIDLDVVANLILGKHKDKHRYFLAQIISSPYDADKLDYIARDSYFCGLSLTVDLARFYSMIATAIKSDKRVLVLRNYVPLEQIIFSKMTLSGSVYQHQKVKCLDHMLRAIIRNIMSSGEAITLRGKELSFNDPVDYLYFTDDEFFNQGGGFGDDFTRRMLNRFKFRDLFVRCVEISRRTIDRDNWETIGRKTLVDLAEDDLGLLATEAELLAQVPQPTKSRLHPGELLLSVPALPTINTEHANIQLEKDGPILGIAGYFPVSYWSEAYIDNKWRAYVYAPREHAPMVRDTALSVLTDFELHVSAAASNQACRL